MHGSYGSQGQGAARNDGQGYYSSPSDRIRETNHNIMEMQNNAHIDDLSDQVSEAGTSYLLLSNFVVNYYTGCTCVRILQTVRDCEQ